MLIPWNSLDHPSLQTQRHAWATVLFAWPAVAVCEWSLWCSCSTPELARQVCFWHPLLHQTALARPGAFSLLLLILLFLQWRLLQHDWSWPRGRVIPRMFLQSVCLGLLPACVAWLIASSGSEFPVATENGLRLESLSISGGDNLAMFFPARALTLMCQCIGAGVFEEVAFRLVLLSLLSGMAVMCGCSRRMGLLLAVLGSSAVFSLAHDPGMCRAGSLIQFGEVVWQQMFSASGGWLIYRFVAGCYLASIALHWGLGVAVGTHICFNATLALL